MPFEVPLPAVLSDGADSEEYRSLRRRATPRKQRFKLGKALREKVPRRRLGEWKQQSNRPDPIDLIKFSHLGRVPSLIPVRVGRMVTSPYGFLRGTAVVMADDVAYLPATGITPVVCGDAHLGNFGFYASPEGELVIDLNDFDEAHPGAWEWDLRRLAASIWVAGRENNATEGQCEAAVRSCAAAYRDQVHQMADQPLLQRSYSRMDADRLSDSTGDRNLKFEIERAAKKARSRTSDRALPRFTEEHQGTRRIVEEPPLITRLGSLEYDSIAAGLDEYLRTLAPHWARAIGGYHLTDIAHKVVGVGSVGLRAYVALLEGSSPSDVVFLQLKQARRSVLGPYVHGEQAWHRHQGQRVVEYQQALQTVSDPLLGWTSIDERQYYVRQFRNSKGTVPLDAIDPGALSDYAGIVGNLLGKGHGRTSGASMIAGYLGTSASIEEAMASFARLYADQTEADHASLVEAVRRGDLPCDPAALENRGSAFRPQ